MLGHFSCVKIIQWGKLWCDFPVITVSHHGEWTVSFEKVDLPESLTLHLKFLQNYQIVHSDFEAVSWLPQNTLLIGHGIERVTNSDLQLQTWLQGSKLLCLMSCSIGAFHPLLASTSGCPDFFVSLITWFVSLKYGCSKFENPYKPRINVREIFCTVIIQSYTVRMKHGLSFACITEHHVRKLKMPGENLKKKEGGFCKYLLAIPLVMS